MSIRRRRWSASGAIDAPIDARSVSAPTNPVSNAGPSSTFGEEWHARRASAQSGRSLSYTGIRSVSPALRLRGPTDVSRKRHESHEQRTARLAILESSVRALRRANLTHLIRRKFEVWVACHLRILAHRKEELATLARRCVQLLMTHSSYGIAKRYYHQFASWGALQRERKAVRRRLLQLRRAALKALVRHYFAHWCDACLRRQQCTQTVVLERRAQEIVMRDAWRKWMRLWRRRGHYASAVQPALRHIQRSAARSLLRRALSRWHVHGLVRQRLQSIVETSNVQLLRRAFLAWMRRRFRTLQHHEALRFMRKNLRMMARSRVRTWMRWAVARGVARLLEQANLKIVAGCYLHKWRRASQCTAQVSHLRACVAMWRRRRAFALWFGFLNRIVRSYLSEQRHLVCILQRYFLEWKVHVQTHKLSYHAMRMLATSLKRQDTAAQRHLERDEVRSSKSAGHR